MIVGFGKWRPDLAPLNADANAIINAIITTDGYEMIPSPTIIGPSGFGDVPLKLILGVSSTGVSMAICLGENGSKRTVSNIWVPLAGSAMSSESWVTVPWGDVVYAFNGVNKPQRINLIDGGDFSQINTPNDLTFKYAAAVADFLVGADVREFSGNVRWPYRVQWSGLQRPEEFTPNPAIQSDFTDVTDIGQFRGITGGEWGILLGSIGMSRMDFVGQDITFKITPLERDVGCEIPNSIARFGDMTIFYSKRGWRATTGESSYPIGEGHIDKWFAGLYDPKNIHRMSSRILHNRNVILYAFVSKFSTDGFPDYVLAYNWNMQAWTYGTYRVQILGESVVASATTDDPVIPLDGWTPESTTDDFAIPTDGWEEDRSFSAAMVNGSLARLDQSNPNIVAQFETKEIEINPGSITTVAKILPMIFSASNITATVFSRKNQAGDTWRSRSGLKPQSSGLIVVNMKDRYHKFRLFVSGPFKKSMAVKIIDAFPSGSR